MILNNQEPEKGQVLLYQTEENNLRLECRFVGNTLWLSQTEICTLYGKAKATIACRRAKAQCRSNPFCRW